MAKKQLFEDAEALINGYGLSAKRGTRKVFFSWETAKKW